MLRIVALAGMLMACLAINGRSPSTVDYDSGKERLFGSEAAQDRAQKAWDQYTARQYSEAATACDQGYREMASHGRIRAALWYLNTLASARFRLANLAGALDAYLSARDLALKSGMAPEAAMALSNLSSLYMHVFDTEPALAASREAVSLLRPGKYWQERSQALLQLGRVLIFRKESAQAIPLFMQLIGEASMTGDTHSEGLAWDQLGLAFLESGYPDQAETALANALRIRLLSRDPGLFATREKLARLYVRLGNPQLARQLIDSAFAEPSPDRVQVPLHQMYLTRAEVLRAQGDLPAALADYIRAVDSAEEWRAHGLFGDSFRISADAGLDLMIYDGAVQTAAALYARSRDPKYAVIAWQLCERNRSASLRELVSGGRGWTLRVPPSYWKLLDRLRDLEAERINPEKRGWAADETIRVRMQLAEMESRASASNAGISNLPANAVNKEISRANYASDVALSENFLHKISLTDFQTVLGDSRKLICFRLGDSVSYRWVISKTGFELTQLSGRRQIAQQVRDLRKAFEGGGADAVSAAQKVYKGLFTGITDDNDRWHVALDDELFDVPMASLITGIRDGRPEYLVERRPVEVAPGAWAMGSGEYAPRRGGFLGIGDGVYNTADPRYRTAQSGGVLSFIPALLATRTGTAQFARLIGSGAEVSRAAALAESDGAVLTGARVNRQEVMEALRFQPGIVHIAAHFVAERDGDGKAAIVLGVRPGGGGHPRLELLTAKDIAGLNVPGAVVVLSGCSSGVGRVVPAAGVLGLARAWLAAGARAVVATHWPTVDGTGELFDRFYRYLSNHNGIGDIAPAEALRKAQLDMLRSGTSHSEPRYWAAYQIVGRSN